MKTLKTVLFAAVGFATLVGALVLSGLQPQESEGQSFGSKGRQTVTRKCCYYERANKQQYVICTIDPQCPQITGNLIDWGVSDCKDCKDPIGNRQIPEKI